MLKKISYKIIKYYRDKYIPVYGPSCSQMIDDVIDVSNLIIQHLSNEKPVLICRFGATEMDAMMNYRKGLPFSFLRTVFPFWVGINTKARMKDLSGFYPNDNRSLAKFSDLMFEIVPKIDILVSWLNQENSIKELNDKIKIPLLLLEPYWSPVPWTAALQGKKVLVVHPFADTIRSQYSKRKSLFKNEKVLPDFKTLSTIKSVQSLGGINTGFNTWFDALNHMKCEIDKVDFDIALIGCGAYGMPLAAHCKQMGKKAVHMGGALQLLFGIRGARWEDKYYSYETRAKYPQIDYLSLTNEHWVRPSAQERPTSAQNVENACYW